MKILLIRHAQAKNKQKWAEQGGLEPQRPLSRRGRKKMQESASGLRTLVEHIDVLMSSTLERALQTANILKEEYRLNRVQVSSFLEPATHPATLTEHLKGYPPDEVIALVGHEPHLSCLLAHLTAGQHSLPFTHFSKGGAALVECDGLPSPGRCQLKWLVTSAILEQHKKPLC